MAYVQVLGGLVLLTFGGEYLVRGAVGLALRFGISKMVIGLTIVAFGTSAPEFVVALKAALSGSGGLAMGNVVGSNIANILLILGAAALISPIACAPGVLRRDGGTLLLGTVVFAALAQLGSVDRLAGAAMVLLLAAIWMYTYWSDKRGGAGADMHAREADEIGETPNGAARPILLTVIGLIALLAGAEFLVTGGVAIARAFGISEAVIGLTLVAVGTSLPELAASGMAALRGHADVALGNVVGSNLLNLLGIIGGVSMIVPIPVPEEMTGFDNWAMLGVTVGLLVLLAVTRRINRLTGAGFLLLYGGYIAYQFTGRMAG